jgi:hypothetical protein
MMSHSNPTGDLAVVVEEAIDLLIEKLEKGKLGKTDRPRAATKPSTDPGNVTRVRPRQFSVSGPSTTTDAFPIASSAHEVCCGIAYSPDPGLTSNSSYQAAACEVLADSLAFYLGGVACKRGSRHKKDDRFFCVHHGSSFCSEGRRRPQAGRQHATCRLRERVTWREYLTRGTRA